jgi:nucleotide-binding universal stress UspA family protein
MTAPTAPSGNYLTLDTLVVNRQVARRLPPALAFRYHALPVGKANGTVTVAMANPADKTACREIAAALGASLCVVQGDSAAIDRHLADLWPQEANQVLRLLVHYHASPNAVQVKLYADYLSELLNGYLAECHRTYSPDLPFDRLIKQVGYASDLFILGEPCQSLIGRLVAGSPDRKAAEEMPVSVLAARSPRWPLKRILLVTRGLGLDDVAVEWVTRLARPAGAAVTVLAVQPPLSGADSRALGRGGLADWLTTDTPLGRQLRQIGQQLVMWEIEGKLHFRQGLPDWQIKAEVLDGDPDLIVVAADPSDWWERRLLGRLVGSLLAWVNRPVLVARPTVK